MNFDFASKMWTTHGLYAAESYFNPTDSVTAAIFVRRLSICPDFGLGTSSSTRALPDAILLAEAKSMFFIENAFDLQGH